MNLWRILSILIIFGWACEKGQIAEVPTFLSVETVEFTTSAGQGSSRHLISEIWIYADSQLIGAYPVPSQIPVLGDGMIKLDIFAGIRENGQAAAPVIYPLTSTWSTQIMVNPGASQVIKPVFMYDRNVVFAFIEDFESGNLFRQDLDGDTLTSFHLITDNAIQGRSASVSLSAEHPVLEVASNFSFGNLPSDGSPVFLELEYAAEANLAVGLRSDRGVSLYKLVLFPNDLVPRKIYVNFTQEVQAANANDFQIIFRASYIDEAAKATQEVIIDNIKLLHFRS